MKLQAYVKDAAGYTVTRTPVEDYLWTGRWKIVTIEKINDAGTCVYDRSQTMYLERWVRLFGIIPLFRIWEEEDDFEFRYVDEVIGTCRA